MRYKAKFVINVDKCTPDLRGFYRYTPQGMWMFLLTTLSYFKHLGKTSKVWVHFGRTKVTIHITDYYCVVYQVLSHVRRNYPECLTASERSHQWLDYCEETLMEMPISRNTNK